MYNPGPAAVLGNHASPLLSAEGGGAPCHIAIQEEERPKYIAIYTQSSEPWADFFKLLQLFIWWRSQ
jgi:hypothetical protein